MAPILHSAWDTCLVLKAVGEDVNEAATELMKTITPARIESWTIRSRWTGQTNPSPSLITNVRWPINMTKWVLLALCLPRLVWYPAMELPDNYLLAPAPHAIEAGNG